DNGDLFDPGDPATTPVGIADRANNLLQANGPDGLTHFRLLLADTANKAPEVLLVPSPGALTMNENNPANPHSAVFGWTGPFSSTDAASVAISIYDVDS